MGKVYGHRVDRRGRVHVVDETLPKGMRGVDPEFDVHSFTEGPIARLRNRRRR